MFRISRLTKYRKKQKNWLRLFIPLQIAAIYYLGIYGLTYFTATTNALFTDNDQVAFSVKAADEFPSRDEEWDKSSLSFISQGISDSGCDIYAVVQNGQDSKTMKGSVTYEVYWIDKGNPKNGQKIAEGTVSSLDSGKAQTLTYTPDKSGNYMFKAYQRDGHPGKGELWSEEIAVIISQCETENENSSLENESLKENDNNSEVQSNDEELDVTEESESDQDANKEESIEVKDETQEENGGE